MPQITIGKGLAFYEEAQALPGVKRVAGMVKQDIELVTGVSPAGITSGQGSGCAVLYGTIGHSPMLDALEAAGKLDLNAIRGKWECYSFQVIETPLAGIGAALVIAGSDKRGTIYGLFHLSELIGVSPLVNWNHVLPRHQDTVVLDDRVNMVSRVPSVKYRGFFINDEWPAFGNWAKTHFGSMNAACYAPVFELLLRMKGDYLWPAMWNSNFSLDGPGLENAVLADELGVVMSTSHHEPCMRSGQEYSMVRGRGSIYGDAWDYLANPEGITRFWRDGLTRNKDFENVITLGMRGENDTAIMQHATLEENIQLIRNVLKTQNQLIREIINPDVRQVPRQIVFFSETEEFFYGSKETPGLIGDPELDGVTLMLSDNNHGSTRTLPSPEMRSHPGGYGMYYHMDMHGGPHSFEWVGATYLPKVWEEMTAAYEYGVREIWVTNIGDIGTQEFGLSYFLDLAYDIDVWGGQDAAITTQYTAQWVRRNFGAAFAPADLPRIEGIITDYTRLLARRKHEKMGENTYHPTHYGEAEEVLQISEHILTECDALKTVCPQEDLSAFISLIYFPACGTANLMKMWILTGRNHLYAKQNRVAANRLADEVQTCIEADEALVNEYHTVDGGKYYGFGLSEHIGFVYWNDEDNKLPIRMYITPANRPRMIVSRVEDTEYATGFWWNGRKPQVWQDFLRPDVSQVAFDVACGSKCPISWHIETDCPWMQFSCTGGTVAENQRVTLTIDRSQITGKAAGQFAVVNEHIQEGTGAANIIVEVDNTPVSYPKGTFVEANGCIAMEAQHYTAKRDVPGGSFALLKPYGRLGTALKAFPATANFENSEERPYLEYTFAATKDGNYHVQFHMSATTPVTFEPKQYIGYSVNGGAVQVVNTVHEENRPFFGSEQWYAEGFANVKLTEAVILCHAGVNTLRFYAVSPAIILEKIVLWPDGTTLPESYLGPRESYRC